MFAIILSAVISQTVGDDAKHLAFSAVGAGASYGVSALVTDDRRMRALFAVSVPLAAGFGRELTQALAAQRWTGENTRDMGLNLGGVLFGALFAYAIDRCITKGCAL